MLFRFGLNTPLAEALNPVVLVLYLVCALLMVLITVAFSLDEVVRLKDASFGALVAAFPNSGFMGVPLLAALFGPAIVGPMIATLLIDMFFTSSLCTAQRAQRRRAHAAGCTTGLRQLGVNILKSGETFFGGSVVGSSQGGPVQPISIGALAGDTALGNTPFSFTSTVGVSPGVTLFAGFPKADLEYFLQALRENEYLRVLAQPNLVAMSGEEARFLAPLPLSRLSPEIELAETLARWGIRSVGDLARLPKDEIASRLGPLGQRLHLADLRGFRRDLSVEQVQSSCDSCTHHSADKKRHHHCSSRDERSLAHMQLSHGAARFCGASDRSI